MSYRWSMPICLFFLWVAPASAKDIALSFDAPSAKTPVTSPTTRNSPVSLSFTPGSIQTPDAQAPISQIVRHTLQALFHGGSDSIVARAGRVPAPLMVAIRLLTMAMWTPATKSGIWVAFPISMGPSLLPKLIPNSSSDCITRLLPYGKRPASTRPLSPWPKNSTALT